MTAGFQPDAPELQVDHFDGNTITVTMSILDAAALSQAAGDSIMMDRLLTGDESNTAAHLRHAERVLTNAWQLAVACIEIPGNSPD